MEHITTKNQLESVKKLDEFNALLLRQKKCALALSYERNPFAIINAKEDNSLFIPAIIEAIQDEKDADCTILSVEDYDYGYALELKVEVTRDGESYTDTFEGNFIVQY